MAMRKKELCLAAVNAMFVADFAVEIPFAAHGLDLAVMDRGDPVVTFTAFLLLGGWVALTVPLYLAWRAVFARMIAA